MRLKPRITRLILNGFYFTLICVGISLITSLAKILIVREFMPNDFVSTYVVIIIGVIFTIMLCFRAQIVLTDKKIIIRYFFKEKSYAYKDIEYIDDLHAKKKKTLVFYLYSNGKRISFPTDKKFVVLKELLKRSEKRVTRIEFLNRHPIQKY